MQVERVHLDGSEVEFVLGEIPVEVEAPDEDRTGGQVDPVGPLLEPPEERIGFQRGDDAELPDLDARLLAIRAQSGRTNHV